MRELGPGSVADTICNATAIRKASRRITALYDSALEPCGLRSTQYTILNELQRGGARSPTLRELALTLVMDRSALGHNLRPLERDGLVALEVGADDRRHRCIVITAAGKAKWRKAKRLWQSAQDRFESAFGVDNAAALRRSLMAIAADERLTSPAV